MSGPPKKPNTDQPIEWLSTTLDAGCHYVNLAAKQDGETDYYLQFAPAIPGEKTAVQVTRKRPHKWMFGRDWPTSPGWNTPQPWGAGGGSRTNVRGMEDQTRQSSG